MNKIVVICPDERLLNVIRRLENINMNCIHVISNKKIDNGSEEVEIVSNTKLVICTKTYINKHKNCILVFGNVSLADKQAILDRSYAPIKESSFYVCSLPFVSHFLFLSTLGTRKYIMEEKRKEIDSSADFMASLGIRRLSIGIIANLDESDFIDSCFIKMIIDDHFNMKRKVTMINGIKEIFNKEKMIIKKEKINMLVFQKQETIQKFLMLLSMIPEAKKAKIHDYDKTYYLDYEDYQTSGLDDEFLFSMLLLMKSNLHIDINQIATFA